jgi:Arc/MetJ family transcription regulator
LSSFQNIHLSPQATRMDIDTDDDVLQALSNGQEID